MFTPIISKNINTIPVYFAKMVLKRSPFKKTSASLNVCPSKGLKKKRTLGLVFEVFQYVRLVVHTLNYTTNDTFLCENAYFKIFTSLSVYELYL